MTAWAAEKRAMHKELKQARYNILRYIDHLDKARCGFCRGSEQNSTDVRTKCECEAAKEIRKLGEILNGNKQELIESYKELLRVNGLAKLTEQNLTVERYLGLKEAGLTDTKIQKQLGWHGVKMNQWKRRKGLIKGQEEDKPAEVKKEPKIIGSDAKGYPVLAPEITPINVAEPEVVTTIKQNILENIGKLIEQQTDKGVGKYNHTLDDCPIDKYDWQNMIIEELIDALQYQQKEMRKMRSIPADSMDEYQQATKRTERQDLSHRDLVLNYGLGISGESGEIADMVKKHFFQGHTLDTEAVKKEIGDVMYYAARLAALFDFKLSDVTAANLKKLEKRYPNGFTEKDSVNRSE